LRHERLELLAAHHVHVPVAGVAVFDLFAHDFLRLGAHLRLCVFAFGWVVGILRHNHSAERCLVSSLVALGYAWLGLVLIMLYVL